ncbi:hypothetical protein LCGC14_0838140 [marine sediment metagenome]|uniref:Uncharacterized protein n=1 Tax=marine sediment metagenome TaxID=412755 RepID=A0A0F9RYN1_9ZZZZ
MELVKKITPRTVGCLSEPGQEFVVFGMVYRAQPETTDKGPFIRFGGMFEARRGKDEFRSSELIVPSVVESQVMSAYQAATAEAGPEAQVSVALAFRFRTVEDKSSVIGYIWRADMIKDPLTTDPLADLRAEVYALPAPKGDK